jgi:rhodanese-related sulfurtransferase
MTTGCNMHGQNSEYVLSASEFADKIKETPQYQIVDVRTPDEFNQEHLADAINIDWKNTDSFEKQISTLDQSTPLFVYCRSGKRSAAAANKMRKEGFTVYELRGGILEWKEAELPVTDSK